MVNLAEAKKVTKVGLGLKVALKLKLAKLVMVRTFQLLEYQMDRVGGQI